MELSPEIRKYIRPAAAGLGLLAALIFAYLRLSGGPSAGGAGGAGSRYAPGPGSLVDPTLQLSRLSDEHLIYSGNGRNIFQQGAEPIPTQQFDPRTVHAQNTALPTPVPVVTQPPLPPINLVFYGFANKPGQPKKIFLKDGEDIFVGSEGDVVDRNYKIVHIGTNSTDIEDLLNNNRQTLPLVLSERG